MTAPKIIPPLTSAQQALVTANLAMAKLIASRFAGTTLGQRLGDFDDVHQQALYGLARAAAGFRPELGWRFSTYAYSVIRSFLLRAGKTEGLVKIPDHIEPQCKGAALHALNIFHAGADLDPLDRETGGHELEHAEQRFRVITLMNRLPMTERDVVRMLFIYGYKVRHLARERGMTERAVRVARDSGLDRLRRWLEG